MSKKTLVVITAIALMSFLPFAAKAEMSVAITYPPNGAVVSPCQDITIKFDVKTSGETIKELRLFYNGLTRGLVKKEPWEYVWKNLQRGRYVLQAQLKDTNNNIVWSDPITFRAGPVSNGEKLLNGSFECDTKLTHWTLQLNEGAQATATVVPEAYFDDANYLMIEISNGGSATWHIQLNQTCPVDSGHIYEISFFADADVKKTIDIGMQENQEPWASQLWQSVEIDGANLYGPIEFEAYRTDPTNVFRVNVGGNTTTIYLDGFSIIDRSASGVKSKQIDATGRVVGEYELLSAYPNPFNLSTTIPYRLNREAAVRLAVFNLQGQLIKVLAEGVQPAGSHRVLWDGLDEEGNIVPSGVYMIRLETTGRHGLPIQLSRKIALVK